MLCTSDFRYNELYANLPNEEFHCSIKRYNWNCFVGEDCGNKNFLAYNRDLEFQPIIETWEYQGRLSQLSK